MLGVKVRGIRGFNRSLTAALDNLTKEAEETARGLAAAKLGTLIRNTPQWSGDMASNWRLSVNRIDRRFTPGNVPVKSSIPWEPYQQFDTPAINVGLAENFMADADFKLGDTIHITNYARHDDDYAAKILAGTLPLRAVNLKADLNLVMEEFNKKYSGTLTGHQIGYLRRLRAGSRWS